MKLLPKRMVNASVAQARKEQIDRGKKLAEKVDTVRDTLSKEQKALDEFRAFATAAVQKEVDTLLRTKEDLVHEIADARATLAKLRTPLDAEWEQVQDLREDLDSLMEGVHIRESALQTAELNIATERKKIAIEQGRAQEETEQARLAHRDAQTHKEEALSLLAEAQRRFSSANRSQLETERRLQEQASALENKEAILDRRWLEADRRELEFNNRERQLKDREDTLARNIIRYGKRTNR
jgi:hypothetical protein